MFIGSILLVIAVTNFTLRGLVSVLAVAEGRQLSVGDVLAVITDDADETNSDNQAAPAAEEN